MIRGRPVHGNGMKQLPKKDYSTVTRPATAGTFTQKLDHLGNATGTFSQRYWYNNQWYQSGGPAFLMLGGEGPEDPYWVESGNLEWTTMAQKAGAWVFDLEHRFYGETHPTPDMSSDNLKFLSSVQAIEDAAFFIQGMIQKFPQLASAKWVSFGGSYSGNLAAWLRVKHPELVSYAVGSSGPVYAEVDFPEYLEVVQNSISSTDAGCAASVTAGFNQVAQLVQTAAGRASAKSTFNICQDLDINNANLMAGFWETVYSPYMEIVQYSGDNAGSFENSLTIKNAICRFHNDNSSSVLQRMKKMNDYFDEMFGYFGCMDIDYNDMIQWMQDTSYGEAADARAWVWQTCTEFGYYQSTSSPTSGPWFGGVNNLPCSYYVQQCADIYGSAYTADYVAQAVAVTNAYYGGRDNMNSSYIILPNGSFDPWHALGKLTSSDPTIVPVVIQGTSHCADMYGPGPNDSADLTAGRAKISSTLLGWLGASQH